MNITGNVNYLLNRVYSSFYKLISSQKEEECNPNTVIQEEGDSVHITKVDNVIKRINEAARYSLGVYVVKGENIELSRGFVRESEHSSSKAGSSVGGEMEFFINGDKVPAQMGPERLIEWLQTYEKDKDNLKIWSQVWNCGLTILLTQEIRKEYIKEQNFDPTFSSSSSRLDLDTKNRMVICKMNGTVKQGIDFNILEPVFFKDPKKFEGSIVVDLTQDKMDINFKLDSRD